jgi:hypothetical protein
MYTPPPLSRLWLTSLYSDNYWSCYSYCKIQLFIALAASISKAIIESLFGFARWITIPMTSSKLDTHYWFRECELGKLSQAKKMFHFYDIKAIFLHWTKRVNVYEHRQMVVVFFLNSLHKLRKSKFHTSFSCSFACDGR